MGACLGRALTMDVGGLAGEQARDSRFSTRQFFTPEDRIIFLIQNHRVHRMQRVFVLNLFMSLFLVCGVGAVFLASKSQSYDDLDPEFFRVLLWGASVVEKKRREKKRHLVRFAGLIVD